MLFRFVEEGFDRVLFDCDSTLSSVEGLDELARRKKCVDRVAEITSAAMEGRVDFADSLERRLSLIRPTAVDLQNLGELYVKKAVSGGRELTHRLQHAGIEVHIVSGGFLPAIRPLAEYLGIPEDRIIANEMFFDRQGCYTGFDTGRPTAHSYGKKLVAESLSGVKALVGDGASDLEAAGSVDLLIGYCGVVRRQTVERQADVVVYSPTLMSIFPLLVGAHRLSSESHPIDAHVRVNSEALRQAYLAAGLRISA